MLRTIKGIENDALLKSFICCVLIGQLSRDLLKAFLSISTSQRIKTIAIAGAALVSALLYSTRNAMAAPVTDTQVKLPQGYGVPTIEEMKELGFTDPYIHACSPFIMDPENMPAKDKKYSPAQERKMKDCNLTIPKLEMYWDVIEDMGEDIQKNKLV